MRGYWRCVADRSGPWPGSFRYSATTGMNGAKWGDWGIEAEAPRKGQRLPHDAVGLFADLRERGEFAAMEHQWRTVWRNHTAALDFTDEDDVVALVVAAAVMALEPRQ